jgi:hypothetical protein
MVGVWDPNRMQLVPGTPECLRWFRKNATNKTFGECLFLYRVIHKNLFMLGRWLAEYKVFLPVMEIGAAPVLNDDVVAEYLAIVRPRPEQTARVAIRQAADNQSRMDEDLRNERADIKAKLLRDECGIKADPEDGSIFLPPDVLAG